MDCSSSNSSMSCRLLLSWTDFAAAATDAQFCLQTSDVFGSKKMRFLSRLALQDLTTQSSSPPSPGSLLRTSSTLIILIIKLNERFTVDRYLSFSSPVVRLISRRSLFKTLQTIFSAAPWTCLAMARSLILTAEMTPSLNPQKEEIPTLESHRFCKIMEEKIGCSSSRS